MNLVFCYTTGSSASGCNNAYACSCEHGHMSRHVHEYGSEHILWICVHIGIAYAHV